jgi:MYXO-CTERM domain-containing protein
MTKVTGARLVFVAACVSVALAAPAASAQTCSADTDCPQGFACVASATTTPVCKGTGCPADAGAAEPAVTLSCQQKACTTDADCGTGMVCYELKSTGCYGSGGSSSGCAPNTACDAGTVVTSVETCTTTTRDVCLFKWQLPCNADADCGDGFVCAPNVSGGCATSGGAVSGAPNGTAGATGGGGSSPAPAADGGAPACPTTTSYPGWCTPKAATCTSDSQCPGGWTCTAVGTPVPVTGGGAPASVPADGAAPAPVAAVDAGGSPTMICVGPFGAGAPTRGGVDTTTAGQAAAAGHDGNAPAVAPGAGGSGAAGGTTGGASAGASSSGGGCAVAPGRAADRGLFLLGLALAGIAVRRRRR